MIPIHPEKITVDERLSELAEILALGLMRVRARQSREKSRNFGESSLDCIAGQSGHADVLNVHGAPQ